MSNKFLSFLSAIGKDFKKGLDKVLPFAETAAVTVIPALFPAIGPIFNTVVGVVVQTEQKFAAMGQQSGTGTQKLAEATSILGPLLSQLLAADGKTADSATVMQYINAVVAFLNAVPASSTTSTTTIP